MSLSNGCFVTCIQISQEAGKVVWYSHLLKNFPQFVLIHTFKGFSIVNEANVFSGILLLFQWSNRHWQFDLWFPLPFLNPAWTSGSSWFMYYWSLAWRILSIILLVCEMSPIVQYFEHSLALPFFEIGMKLTFSSPVTTAEFSKFAGILSAALSQHHHVGFEIAQLEFHHLH